MGESSLVQHADIEVYLLDAYVHLVGSERADLQILATAAYGDFLVIEVNYPVCVACDGGGVAGDEKLAVAFSQPYRQRAALARSDYRAGFVAVDHCNRIRAYNLLQGGTYGACQVGIMFLPCIFYELQQHFRVCFAAEGESLLLELLPQCSGILDDAVMHHCKVSALGDMRMRVDLVGDAVGGPAGMCYAKAAGAVVPLHHLLQIGDFAYGLIDVQFSFFVKNRNSCGVVTAVFEPVKAPDQNRICLAASEISNNSTHIFVD